MTKKTTATTLPPLTNFGGGSTGGSSPTTNAASPANRQIAAIIAAGSNQSGIPAQEIDPNSTTTGVNYVPEISQSNPYTDPMAWNLPVGMENRTIYTGNGNLTSSQLDENHLVANIASRLGVRIAGKTDSQIEELISAKIPKGTETMPGLYAAKGGINYALLAQSLGVPSVGKTTGVEQQTKIGDIINAIRANPGELGQLQQQLYDAGFFSGGNYDDPTQAPYAPGHLDPQTREAIGTAVKYTLGLNSTAAPGQKVTLQEAVAKLAYETAGSGGPQQWEGGGPAKIPSATQAQLAIPLQQAGAAQLGMAPTASDLAQFTKEFQTSQAAHALQDVGNPDLTGQGPTGTNGIPATAAAGTEYGTGVTIVPGMPSATNAAVEFEQASNPNQFMAHRFANAYGLMLNAMIGNRGMEQALPGFNPNATQATTGV